MEEVRIADLKITTAGDDWLKHWIENNGPGIAESPQYYALTGTVGTLIAWMGFRKIDWRDKLAELISIYQSLRDEGQKEPIKIYQDMRINTGHKRAAAMLALGFDTIKVEIVPDDTKL